MGQRLDKELVKRGLVPSRSQAESIIKLGLVKVDGKIMTKPAFIVQREAKIWLTNKESYVSRAGLKLASVADLFDLDFEGKTILDVGSSTGGFTDYALQHGAKKVIAVDVGTNQLHPSLRIDKRIELHEQTDIREFVKPTELIDIVLIDVSFISQQLILPKITELSNPNTLIVSMLKPQFETSQRNQKNRGVIKNERLRRQILKDFENWTQKLFKILNKADSQVAGEKGNLERFYLLKPITIVN